MKMKQITLLILTLLFLFSTTIVSFAQENDKESADIVYLHNGSKIVGKITHINYDNHIDIETESGSTMRIAFKDVKKIEYSAQTELEEQPTKFKNPKEKHIPGKKIYYAISLYATPGIDGDGYIETGRGISFSMGYRFSKNMILGAGLGLDTYEFAIEKALIPIFAEYRYEFLNKSFTPFINIRGGYAALHPVINNNFFWGGGTSKGGLNFNPSVGVRLASRAKGHFNFSLGYTIQEYEETGFIWTQNPDGTDQNSEYTDKVLFQRFTLGATLNF